MKCLNCDQLLHGSNIVDVSDESGEIICPRCNQQHVYSFVSGCVSLPTTLGEKCLWYVGLFAFIALISFVRSALGVK